VAQRKLKLAVMAVAGHIYICDQHKAKIQCARTKRRRKNSDDDDTDDTGDGSSLEQVDLYSLQVNTLRRYKKYYKVSTKPGLNKAQLAETIMKHFKSIPVKEKDTLTYFIYTVKTNANKIDQKNGITTNSDL
jgi:histone deacetylase complex subunit SAP30